MAGEIFVFFVLAWVFVSFITGLHASEQGKTRWWGVIVFFFGIFGLMGYAISLASD